MSFLRKLFSNKRIEQEEFKEQMVPQPRDQISDVVALDEYEQIGLTQAITQEEKELVSAIMSAIVSGDHPDATVKIHSIMRIDENKEVAAVVATAIAANDSPTSTFRLVSVAEGKE